MLKNNTATFVANPKRGTIEITQLKENVTIEVDAFVLLSFLENNDSQPIKKSRYCHICNLHLNYTTHNFHLYAGSNIINTYLVKGFDQQLKQYILDSIKYAKEPLKVIFEEEIDNAIERYLPELSSDNLLELYKKRIIYEAQLSDEELLWIK